MQRDINSILKENSLEMKYFQEGSYDPGMGETEGEWTDYQEYCCDVEQINKININSYPYGDLKEGDIVLSIPKDTGLDTEADEYKVKFQGKEYTSKTGLLQSERVRDTFLHYVMVAALA